MIIIIITLATAVFAQTQTFLLFLQQLPREFTFFHCGSLLLRLSNGSLLQGDHQSLCSLWARCQFRAFAVYTHGTWHIIRRRRSLRFMKLQHWGDQARHLLSTSSPKGSLFSDIIFCFLFFPSSLWVWDRREAKQQLHYVYCSINFKALPPPDPPPPPSSFIFLLQRKSQSV